MKKNPRLFFANGTITQYTSSTIDVLKKLKEAGQVGNKVALVNVADEFGIEAANNACPYYYANGQVLGQAFEGVGTMDRDAVTEYLKSHTFKTLIGEIDLRSQLQNIAYTVGQWQNGFFRSIAGVGLAQSELVAPRVKTGWA